MLRDTINAIYPGHPVTLAYLIAHEFSTLAEAAERETGALTSLAIPGSGGRVGSTLCLLDYLQKGLISLSQFFAMADQEGTSEKDFDCEGAQRQADGLKPWLVFHLQAWLTCLPTEGHQIPLADVQR